MFRAYNISRLDFGYSPNYLREGKRILSESETQIEIRIGEFTDPETGRLKANLLTAQWFPYINADIFISHSHKDYNEVVCLAGWLKEKFGLTTFVDSSVWGYSDRLLKLIDDEYCSTGDGFYSYSRRNYSTSHVHMMLSMALTEMIYRTECLFFYNTPNSITPSDVITSKSETLSSWIFAEIGMTRLIHQRNPEKHRALKKSLVESSERYFSREDFEVEYEVDISHLVSLGADEFNIWSENANSFSSSYEALDFLYREWK
jgi:hypothetical protein